VDAILKRLTAIPFAAALVPFTFLQFNPLYRAYVEDCNFHAQDLFSSAIEVERCLCYNSFVNA
jgi:hypothetical protein